MDLKKAKKLMYIVVIVCIIMVAVLTDFDYFSILISVLVYFAVICFSHEYLSNKQERQKDRKRMKEIQEQLNRIENKIR